MLTILGAGHQPIIDLVFGPHPTDYPLWTVFALIAATFLLGWYMKRRKE